MPGEVQCLERSLEQYHLTVTPSHEMYTNQPRQMPHRDLPKHNSFIKIRRVPRPRPFLAKPLPQAFSLYGLKMEGEGGEGETWEGGYN